MCFCYRLYGESLGPSPGTRTTKRSLKLKRFKCRRSILASTPLALRSVPVEAVLPEQRDWADAAADWVLRARRLWGRGARRRARRGVVDVVVARAHHPPVRLLRGLGGSSAQAAWGAYLRRGVGGFASRLLHRPARPGTQGSSIVS